MHVFARRIDLHLHCSQHQQGFMNYSRSCSSTYSHHAISIKKYNPNSIHFIHHHCLLHAQSYHINSFDPNSTTSTQHHRPVLNPNPPGSYPLNESLNHSLDSFDPSQNIQTSWWKCSSKPIESNVLSSNSKTQLTSYQVRINDERRHSFQEYTSQLSELRSSYLQSKQTQSATSLTVLNQSLRNLLNDTKFQNDFRIIWSDLNATEETSDDKNLRFQVIEFQRKAIEVLLNTLIHAVSTCSSPKDWNSSSEVVQNKINIFNQVIGFLIFTNQHRHSNKVISLLGLDPIEGWRNLVKQHLRIRTLKSLISFTNIFNPNLSTWWSSEFTQAKDSPSKLNKLVRIGIFLISALSKEGSVWKAFQLFCMMDKVPILDEPSEDESVRPISHLRRAATALGLVDALISRKKIDYANQVLETISVGEWIGGTIYRRYLLSMLIVKGARGEFSSLEVIGPAYERAWSNSTVMTDSIAGRNKRSRGFHMQDPRIPVARAKIEALGILGETRSAVETFQETICTVPYKFEVSSQLPDLYAEIMRVHLRADDPSSIEKLLTRMTNKQDPYGLNQPDQRHYNILLQSYANRTDIEGCSSVLDRLLALGIRPDIYTYGNISLLFSNLGEPDFIREVIEALAKSETPNQSARLNRELWNILLDAYIESGDWTRAAKLLEYLEPKDNHTKQFDVVTNGSVLKALVVSGSPTDKVLNTFKSMYNYQTGLTADVRSYTLLLLSICDSGMMDLAEALFYSLQDSPSEKQSSRDSITPNVYMYGIMISAFLRIGKPDLAQRYLREMRWSGIRPNLVIYSMLTGDAAKYSDMKPSTWNEGENQVEEEEIQQDGAETAYEMASRFRRELLNDEAHLKGRDNQKLADKNLQESFYWGELPIIRKRLSHRLLGPIIQSYAKSARPAKALEMLRELASSLGSDYSTVSSDGKPIDIDIFTMLLDAYRRAQDPVGVIEVWKEIFRIATKKNDSLDTSEKLLTKVLNLIESDGRQADNQINSKNRGLIDQQRQRKANKLCLPLSIYTDCLSRHGYHEEVAQGWHDVQESGFGFDATNWNELCAAMFRGGNHRMGWWIAERVFYTQEQDQKNGQDEEFQPDDKEDLKWAKILKKTVGFRSVRVAPGMQGTRLDGAKKIESPLRPPNRTSIEKTRRFDDELAVRRSLQSLLNKSVKDSSQMNLDDNQKMSWSQQLYSISQARRELEWKPYEKVFRMLHGSLWRECADVIIKIWEEKKEKSEDNEEENDLLLEQIDQGVKKSVKEIVNGYEIRYPQAMVEVLAMNENSQDIPKGLNREEIYNWNKQDFISRVIKRTIERVLE